MTPAEVVVSLIERFAASDLEGALELYADDVLLTMEFALPHPVKHRGKAGLAQALLAARERRGGAPSRSYADISICDLVVTEATDGETVTAEWTYRSRIGKDVVENRNIVVATVRDGRIVRSRDYHNHVTRAVSEGTIPQLASSIAALALAQDAGRAPNKS